MKRLLYLMMVFALAVLTACGGGEEQKPEAAKEEAAHTEAASEAATKEPIKVGALYDLTGPTGDVGTPYAEGVQAAVEYVNSHGGVNGHPIELIGVDYAYNIQQAQTAYRRFLSQGVVAIQGWGTGDTEALTNTVAKDQIPYLSASYSAHLTDPEKSPYNFFIAADYSTQLRCALTYVKQHWDQDRAPRIAFVYPNHPYGLAPIPAGKAYAEELGFEIVGEENVDLKAIDATTELSRLQKASPDYVWVGGTTQSTAVVLKDADKLNMDATFITNIWGADENIFELAGQAANGNISLQAAQVYGQPSEGMELIKEITNGEHKMTHYIRGFASVLVMVEGMKRTLDQGQELTGPNIKAALEQLRDYDPMGLTPPISYFPDDHRPNMSVNLYRLQDGELVFLDTVTLERRDEWLGF